MGSCQVLHSHPGRIKFLLTPAYSFYGVSQGSTQEGLTRGEWMGGMALMSKPNAVRAPTSFSVHLFIPGCHCAVWRLGSLSCPGPVTL